MFGVTTQWASRVSDPLDSRGYVTKLHQKILKVNCLLGKLTFDERSVYAAGVSNLELRSFGRALCREVGHGK